MKEITIFTDGACVPNPGVGGWAAILLYGIHKRELSGVIPEATNQRAEITAAIEALKALKEPCNVTIWTDSQYLINGATGQWKINSNLDLWADFDLAQAPHQINWQWCKGHSGVAENERADQLAMQAINQFNLSKRRGA
jgi:ribonuclease HI